SSTKTEIGQASVGKAMRARARMSPRIAAMMKPRNVASPEMSAAGARRGGIARTKAQLHMSVPPRFPYAARGWAFERAHADGETERHREIDEEDESEDRHCLHRRLIELLRLESEIGEGDERYERGRLQQLDEEI